MHRKSNPGGSQGLRCQPGLGNQGPCPASSPVCQQDLGEAAQLSPADNLASRVLWDSSLALRFHEMLFFF